LAQNISGRRVKGTTILQMFGLRVARLLGHDNHSVWKRLSPQAIDIYEVNGLSFIVILKKDDDKAMKLRPIIASYSGDTSSKIKQYLNDNVLAVIAGIACSPKNIAEIEQDVLAELVEMHVLKEQVGIVTLDTAVFLRNDIECILNTVTPLAKELCQHILECGSAFRNAPPEITNFLGGIIGLVQGMGITLEQKHIGVDWKNYPGKYARSKVDFDEVCDVYDAIGPDFLNKSVIQGERYTAVFIGPAGDSFKAFTYAINTSDLSKRYRKHLNRYLVDAYAMLVKGEIQNESLRRSAETANMYKQGRWRTAVITNETFHEYESAIQTIIDVTSSYYGEKLATLDTLLHSTIAGQQGVPPANMMLNLSRYIRKVTARELYSYGFFTDTIPEEGTLTVFYENDVELIRQLLI